MKKLLLSILGLFFLFVLASAQSNSNNTYTSSTGGFTVSGFPSLITGLCSQLKLGTPVTKCKVSNIDGYTKTVKCMKIVIDTITGTENDFCWAGQCYPSTDYISGLSATMLAYKTDSTFVGDYIPHNIPGVSHIRYLFYDLNDPSDSISVVITYDAQPVGITNPISVDANQFSIFPNPANALTALRYTMDNNAQNGKLRVHNMLGLLVKEIVLNDKESVITLMTNQLDAGVYFCSFEVDNTIVTTKKLTVTH